MVFYQLLSQLWQFFRPHFLQSTFVLTTESNSNFGLRATQLAVFEGSWSLQMKMKTWIFEGLLMSCFFSIVW